MMLSKLINKHLFDVDQHHQQTNTVRFSKSGFMLVTLLGPIFVHFVHLCWCFYQRYRFIILDIFKLQKINSHHSSWASIVNMSHLFFLLHFLHNFKYICYVSYCMNASIVYFPLLLSLSTIITTYVVIIVFDENNKGK